MGVFHGIFGLFLFGIPTANGVLAGNSENHVLQYLQSDFFLEHLSQFLNNSIDPCENFYRHVCPANIKNDQTILLKYIPPSIQKTFEFPTGDVEIGIGPILEDTEEGDAEIKMRHYAKRLGEFVAGLRPYGKLLEYVNNYGLLSDEVYTNLRRTIHSMVTIMKNDTMTTNSELMLSTTKAEIERVLRTMMIILGKSNAFQEHSIYPKLYNLLSKIWDQLYYKHFSYPKVAYQMGELLRYLYDVSPIEFDAISFGAKYSAFNRPDLNTVKIPITACLLSQAAKNAPSFYGSMGLAFAHEMYLSLTKTKGARSDPRMKEGMECLQTHKRAVCKEIGDDDGEKSDCTIKEGLHDPRLPCYCQLANQTYSEDVADWEGLQLTFMAMEAAIGEKTLKETIYPSLGITNEQMFFYAYAVFKCQESPGHLRAWMADREGDMMRVNQMVTLSKSFNQAFQCSPQSKQARLMDVAKRDHCNQIGQDQGKRMMKGNQ